MALPKERSEKQATEVTRMLSESSEITWGEAGNI